MQWSLLLSTSSLLSVPLLAVGVLLASPFLHSGKVAVLGR
jgi:hypothetical protein